MAFTTAGTETRNPQTEPTLGRSARLRYNVSHFEADSGAKRMAATTMVHGLIPTLMTPGAISRSRWMQQAG